MFQDGELSILGLYGINKTSGPIPMQPTRHPHHRRHLPPRLLPLLPLPLHHPLLQQ